MKISRTARPDSSTDINKKIQEAVEAKLEEVLLTYNLVPKEDKENKKNKSAKEANISNKEIVE
jgi:hypothetical protein